jgi:hypothetical protein
LGRRSEPRFAASTPSKGMPEVGTSDLIDQSRYQLIGSCRVPALRFADNSSHLFLQRQQPFVVGKGRLPLNSGSGLHAQLFVS